jgi:hypothetical protein
MREENSRILDAGDNLPDFDLRFVSGKTLRIPDDLGPGFSAVFFYRGYW